MPHAAYGCAVEAADVYDPARSRFANTDTLVVVCRRLRAFGGRFFVSVQPLPLACCRVAPPAGVSARG